MYVTSKTHCTNRALISRTNNFIYNLHNCLNFEYRNFPVNELFQTNNSIIQPVASNRVKLIFFSLCTRARAKRMTQIVLRSETTAWNSTFPGQIQKSQKEDSLSSVNARPKVYNAASL